MLTPPAGTVSRESAGYQLAPTDFAAAKQLVNPLLPTSDTLKTGQKWFNITCAACHGRDGDATNAAVAPTKERPNRFTGVPSLTGTNVERLSDGEIFHIISVGRGRMPSIHAQVLPEQRWAVIHYLRALNRATLSLTDAEQQLKDLEKGAAAGYGQVAPELAAELATLRKRVAQRRIDLALIQAGGDGAAFAPAKPARPEYEKAAWPTVSEK
jgi:mono/diheme cytochrome c family protein